MSACSRRSCGRLGSELSSRYFGDAQTTQGNLNHVVWRMSRKAREGAAANREIDPAAREIHELVAGAEVEANLRVAANEVGKERREHATHERDGRGDTNPARGRVRDGGLLKHPGRSDRLTRRPYEPLSVFRQRERVRRAMKKFCAGCLFEARDGLRDTRGRHAESAAALGEGTGVDHGDEAAELRKGDVVLHGPSSNPRRQHCLPHAGATPPGAREAPLGAWNPTFSRGGGRRTPGMRKTV